MFQSFLATFYPLSSPPTLTLAIINLIMILVAFVSIVAVYWLRRVNPCRLSLKPTATVSGPLLLQQRTRRLRRTLKYRIVVTNFVTSLPCIINDLAERESCTNRSSFRRIPKRQGLLMKLKL
jgi:hypothetical protein